MNRKHFYKRFIRFVFYTILGFIILVLVASLILFTYKDQIAEKILLTANDIQDGEVSFSEVTLSPFVHFPDVSVKLKDFCYTYSYPFDSLSLVDTIAYFEGLYVAADVINLLSGNFILSKVTGSEGIVKLIEYPDSTINLLHALGKYKPPEEAAVNERQDSLLVVKPIELSLRQITLYNVVLIHSKVAIPDTNRLDISYLEASLDYRTDSVLCKLNTDLALKDLGFICENKSGALPVKLKSSFSFDLKSDQLTIKPSELIISSVIFNLEGNLIFSENVMLNLSVKTTSTDMSFLKAWLSKKGLRNIKSGESYFSGTIDGTFNGQIPRMNFVFGMRKVELYFPKVNQNISGLELEGSFHSGSKLDFSEATLEIRKLHGQLPGGYVKGNLTVHDFSSPEINMLWDLEADITGFDEVFNLHGLSHLKGEVKYYDQAAGKYDPVAKKWLEKENESLLVFDSISADIAGFGTIENMRGRINRKSDTIVINDFSFIMGNSDFDINGQVCNLAGLFISNNENITATLKIVSDTFDLPAFFSLDPRVARSFPYRITGIDIKVRASSSRDKLLRFESNPEILFQIDHLQATIEDLFPQVVIDQGVMLIAEKDSNVYLTFNDFMMNVANGNIDAEVIYQTSSGEPDQVIIDAVIAGLDPAVMFFEKADTIPQISKGILNTHAIADLELRMDSLNFRNISLKLPALDYITEKDTFGITGLTLEAKNVIYFEDKNPLATLSAAIELETEKFESNFFNIEDMAYSINVTNGIYTIYPERIRFFGKEGEGLYELRPFADHPDYKVKYKVENFRFENLLSNLMADTMLTGLMNLDLELEVSKLDKNELFSDLQGYIHMHGNNLTIYGIDLDNLIGKYQKSQKFNLVDLGAVALAGPFGLAVTKGTQFASLAIGNFGETTQVVEMISEWDCNNGRFIIKDVAFKTSKNLMAGQGWIDPVADSLNIILAVLDVNKCNVVSQSIFGRLDSLQYGELNIVGTVLGPVTNLLDGALGKDCKPFYTGRLNHPLAGTKKNK